VVQVTYDPDEVEFRDLLDVFFTIHDPTTRNRQGNDVARSTAPRSSTTRRAEEGREEAVAKATKDKCLGEPIVTEIVPASAFTKAEEEHQEYYERIGNTNPYCAFVVEPKVAKFRKAYFDRLKALGFRGKILVAVTGRP